MDTETINRTIDEYYRISSEKEQIVTLFMLTYRRPYYLKKAINSVLRQSYKNFVLIIIDNLSGDDTPEVVASFKDNRVLYIERDGYGEVSNGAFARKTAKTDFFAILHDDDILEDTFLEKSIDILVKNPSIDVLLSNSRFIDKDDVVIADSARINENGIITYSGGQYLKSRLWHKVEIPLIYPSAIYRTSFILKDLNEYTIPKSGPAGDQLIYFQIERHGGLIAVNKEILFNYRVHEKQASTQYSGIMDIMLMNYLLSDTYYASVLKNEKGCIEHWLKRSVMNIISSYEKGVYGKEKISEGYSLIDSKWKVSAKACLIIYGYRLFVMCPDAIAKVYAFLRNIKANRS